MRSSTQHHRRYSDRWTPADAHPRVAHAGAANANDGASVRAPECRVLECEDHCRRMARPSCSITMRVDDVSRLAAESAGECMENTLEYTILGGGCAPHNHIHICTEFRGHASGTFTSSVPRIAFRVAIHQPASRRLGWVST